MIEALWQGMAADPYVRESAASWLEDVATQARRGEPRGIILAGALAVLADLCGWGEIRSRARVAGRAAAPAPCGCSKVTPLRARD
jgi:hypothetical protein